MNWLRQKGFSLIESLVALLLVTVALFLTLHLTSIQPRTMKRLRANEAALRAVEASIETIRGGSIPLVDGRSKLAAPLAFFPDPAAEGLQLTMDVAPSPDVDDLFLVTVEARYRIARQVRVRRVQTMVWRP
jgi:prepilin-type N-terminal cleavage/methylation domain-containing protein